MQFISREAVRERLTYPLCIRVMREAMRALSSGQTLQVLRSVIPLGKERMFGIMPGAVTEAGIFGAKLISVYPENFATGKQSHQGVLVLFDGATGEPVCIVHAGELTAIRTPAASAVATAELARPNANRMAVLGYGEQAGAHIEAINLVRPLDHVAVWGRDPQRAARFATRMSSSTGLVIETKRSAQEAVAEADIVCTVTSAREPLLHGDWLKAGAHVNLVGSSSSIPCEVDTTLVACSRYIVDSRESVLAMGAEFLKAKAEGLISDDHIVGEIGQILLGEVAGRQSAEQITVYKSLGHIVQDLAAANAIRR